MGNKIMAAPHSSSLRLLQLLVVAVLCCLLFSLFFKILNSPKSFVVLVLHSMFLSFPFPLHSSQLLLGGTGVAMISSSYNPREDNRQFTSVEGENRKSCLIGRDLFLQLK